MTQPTPLSSDADSPVPQVRDGFTIEPLQGLSRGGRWRTEAMRSYGRTVLYWVTRGQGRFTIQGVTRGYGPHNAILLPPGTMHGFDTLGQVGGTVVFFPDTVGPDRSPAVDLGLPGQPLHLRLREVQHQAEMALQIENLQKELAQSASVETGTADRALLHHTGLLGVWFERHADPEDLGDGRAGDRAADRLAAAFTSLVERDFRTGQGVAHYAAALGVTATHLSRSCRAACGRPASALLQDRVHWEARRLLAETGMPVQDIARSLGFRSAAYFTRAFQQRSGQTPSAFRRTS